MSDTTTQGRSYRLSPPDRTGWMFGLSITQLAAVAIGVIVGASLMVTVGAVVGAVAVAVIGGLGIARIGGVPLLETIPLGWRFVSMKANGESVWFERVPVVGGDADHPVPPAMRGLELLTVEASTTGDGSPGSRVAVGHDTESGTISATLRVAGRQFGLLEPAEQDWLISGWGTALGAFVSERNPVVSVRWSQWAAPAGLEEHRVWLSEHLATDPVEDVRAAYEQLLREAGGRTARSEVLVTVTVAIGRVRRRRNDTDQLAAAVETLLGEMRLFAQRLESAGLIVSAPLTPAQWARAMRLRLDPSTRLALDRRQRSLGETAGAANPAHAGPSVTETTWNAWRTDGAWHRTLRVAEWPRIDVGAQWLSDLLLYSGCVRTMTVALEPVARSKSQRSIVRESAKIESDAAHRAEKGFRVGAHHRRARQAVEEREEELVAGYSEFNYAGLITVTAPSIDELDQATDEVSQIAASLGIELRPLHGRHDIGTLASLPVARGIVPKERT